MAEIKDKSIEVFLGELASMSATPGGGSAAALMGAQAAALVSMVCNLTIGKPKYAAVAEDMKILLMRSETLRLELLEMIKADVDVFNKLMNCYGLVKATDEEKAERSLQIQAVLKEATLVPLACAKACSGVLLLSKEAAEKGNVNVVSDAGVAVMSAYAGLKSAALNVYINAGSLKDRDFAEEQLENLGLVMKGAEVSTEEIYQLVKEKL